MVLTPSLTSDGGGGGGSYNKYADPPPSTYTLPPLTPTNPVGPGQVTAYGGGSPGMGLVDPVAYQNWQNAQNMGLSQLGINTALTQNSQQYLQDKTALDRQALGLGRAQIGLDRNDIDAQLANIGINRQIAAKMLANQLKDFGISRTESHQGAERNRFGLKSDLTARGAFISPALGRGLGRIQEDLTNQLGHIATGETGARLGYKREMAGYDLATANAKNRARGLDIMSQKYGLDEKGLTLALNNGIKQLGLQGVMDATQIMAGLGSGNTQFAGVLNSMLQLMGLPPLNMGPQAGTGTGSTPSTGQSATNTRTGIDY